VKRTISILAILLLNALAVFPASTQQPAPIVCVIYMVQDLSPAGSTTGEYEQTITDAVNAAAGAQGYALVALNAWQEAASAQSLDPARINAQTPALAVARAVGADVAVTGSFAVHGDQIYYSIECWDVAAGRLAAGIQQTTPLNLAFFTSLNQELTTDLFPSVQLERNESPRLVFTSPDQGMEVILGGDLDIGQIANGQLSWPVAGLVPGTKVTVEKRKTGYHTDRQTVTLVTGKDIPLAPLTPEHSTAYLLDATIGQLLGAGVTIRAYGIPDWFYISMGSYFWLQPPATFAARVAFHDDYSLGLGSYVLFPPSSWFRLGVSTGVGVIFTALSTPGFPVYSEFYIDVASIWIEVDLARTAFYFRQDFKYALGLGTNLLGTGWLIESGPLMTLGVIFR
jgi:hypothetical protein